MSKYIISLMFFLYVYSMCSFADDSVSYGYDKSNGLIYAQVDGKKDVMMFSEDYLGNPSYAFDFFSDSPAIIADSRSLHDSTVYATLKYKENKFIIDCLYVNIKSKKNGFLIKEGNCKLNMAPAKKYGDFIEGIVSRTESYMDSVDTSQIISGKQHYLPIVIYNSKDKLIYQLYKNKQALLDDNYSILSLNSDGICQVFTNSPWVVSNKESKTVEIMRESILDSKVKLNKENPDKSKSNQCSLYPPLSVVKPKSYFYDSSYKIKKSYLVKGDKVNLLSVSDDRKWCNARYINVKNSSTDGIMLCADLSI